MTRSSRDHALVLGAGVAGLLAARAVADTYDQVTVVDRDELPDRAMERRGVPQGRHAHALLARGQQAMETLFPGLTAALIAHGAPVGDALGDVRLHFGGHRLRRRRTGLLSVSAGRPFLEAHLRQRVLARPGMRFAAPSDIVGLIASPDGGRITGARILRRAHGSAEETIDADLVVDATGRGSRTPVWLAALGYPRPPEDRVQVGLGYTTYRYRLPDDALDGDLATLHGPHPACPRGGVLARVEGGEWLLTLFGIGGDHPPPDHESLVAFARSLSFTDIYHAIRDHTPVTTPALYRFPTSRWRRYERLTRFPDRLIVLGDGVCSFNPVYGQGMTVAALEALLLREHLRRHRGSGTRRIRVRLARATRTAWSMAAAGDLALPGVPGRRTPAARVAQRYVSRTLATAAGDAEVSDAFVRVTGLVDPPTALLRPRVAARVLGHRTAASGQDRHRAPVYSRADGRPDAS